MGGKIKMNEYKMVDLSKVRKLEDIAGCWVWQFGYYQPQYIWDRTKYKKPIFWLLNMRIWRNWQTRWI